MPVATNLHDCGSGFVECVLRRHNHHSASAKWCGGGQSTVAGRPSLACARHSTIPAIANRDLRSLPARSANAEARSCGTRQIAPSRNRRESQLKTHFAIAETTVGGLRNDSASFASVRTQIRSDFDAALTAALSPGAGRVIPVRDIRTEPSSWKVLNGAHEPRWHRPLPE